MAIKLKDIETSIKKYVIISPRKHKKVVHELAQRTTQSTTRQKRCFFLLKISCYNIVANSKKGLFIFMKKQPKNENGNIKREYSQTRQRFEIIPNYHLLDKRLTLAEKGFLTCLLILPNKWKISQRATAKYLKIESKTFNKHIKKLVEIGYIELKKGKANKTDYIIKDKPTSADFDIKYINEYTIGQLNGFLNDNRIEQRYKDLIKKALGMATATSEHFKETLNEIEEETAEETTENDKLPFEI